jgi:hypothetical protein
MAPASVVRTRVYAYARCAGGVGGVPPRCAPGSGEPYRCRPTCLGLGCDPAAQHWGRWILKALGHSRSGRPSSKAAVADDAAVRSSPRPSGGFQESSENLDNSMELIEWSGRIIAAVAQFTHSKIMGPVRGTHTGPRAGGAALGQAGPDDRPPDVPGSRSQPLSPGLKNADAFGACKLLLHYTTAAARFRRPDASEIAWESHIRPPAGCSAHPALLAEKLRVLGRTLPSGLLPSQVSSQSFADPLTATRAIGHCEAKKTTFRGNAMAPPDSTPFLR